MNTPATERSYFGIQYDLKRNMRPFSADAIRALPSDAAGVYAIWIVEQLIYVGKATACIRTRLLSHLYNTDRSINPCLYAKIGRHGIFDERTARFTCVVLSLPDEEIGEIESRLIEDWQPECNRRGR